MVVLSEVLVLMLATSVFGPVLTERFAPRMLARVVADQTPAVS